MGKVIQMQIPRKRSFTSAEKLIEEVRREIFGDSNGYKALAERCAVSPSTIGNLANGKTKWPRPTTLFPLLHALNLELTLTHKGPKK